MMSSGGKGKLLLVDGNSLLYRSFFAIPRLTNRGGMPTNAVYGFATVLRKILAEETPELGAVVFDAGGKTFRHQMFEEYKANRPEIPKDLAVQFPHARRLCEVLGFTILEIAGVEADDVIGTLSSWGEKAGYGVIAVSSDKDFLQIVSERVTVLHPGKDLRYDPKEVTERFGVPPERVIDVLGLTGDSIDNVPGVPGIGEKGAVALVQKWGSLEACLENAQKIASKRQREGLLKYGEQARLSKELVRIATDLHLDVRLESLRYRGVERAETFAFFEKLGFSSLLKDYLPEIGSRPGASYRPLESATDLERLVRAARERRGVSLSLVLEGVDRASERILGVGFAVAPGEAFFMPLGHEDTGLPAPFRELVSDASVPKLGHDLKRAWTLLAKRGSELKGFGFDSMIASYVLNPSKRSHDLEALVVEVLQASLGERQPAAEEQPSLPGMGAGATTVDLRSAAERAEIVLRIRDRLEPRLEEEGLTRVFQDIELPLIEVLADMERTGIMVDVQKLRSMSEELEGELKKLTAEIHQLAGQEFNINSPRQLGEILFDKMNLPSFRKTEKQRAASTRMDVLEGLAEHFELPKKILEYRSIAKLKGTYVDALPSLVSPDTGRVHTTFNQTVAATGRLSSSDPNLQNIPIRTELGRRIRSAFVAPPAWRLLSADYSQIELRVLAHMSGDPALIEAFRSGEDIHRRTAMQIFGPSSGLTEAEQRRRAKIINFSIIYGKTAFSLGEEFGVTTREAQAFIDGYFERFPKVRELLDGIIRDARRTGKVTTLFGRHRYIPEIGSRNRTKRLAAERVAVNAPIQGTAADLIKKAMVDLWRELRRRQLRSRLLLQVHDELVLEVPEEEVEETSALVRRVMEEVHPMEVPLRVDISLGQSWLH